MKEQLTKSTNSLQSSSVPVPLSVQKANAAAAAENKQMPAIPFPNSNISSELATRRLALSKIGNDIHRLKSTLQTCANDLNLITVTSYGNNNAPTNDTTPSTNTNNQQQLQQLFEAITSTKPI